MSDKDFVVKNGLVVNGSVLVVNTSTNSVGINTSAPNANVQVVGTANVSGNVSLGANLTVNNTVTVGSAVINSTNYTGTSNNTLYLGGTAAAGYQTTAGLSSNVAGLTANNTTYVNGKTESNLNVNTALTSNSASYVGTLPAASVANTSAPVISGNVTIGNSTVFVTITGNNITGSAPYSNASYNIVQASSLNVGSNVTVNATSFLIGNSTSNVVINSTSISSFANASFNYVNPATVNASGTVLVGSNVYVNASALFLGNSTVNTVVNSSSFITNGFTANSTLVNVNSLIVQGAATVSGNLTVTGNLTLAGSTTFINATAITTNDLNIVLANNASTNTLANNAGIIVGTSANLIYNSTAQAWQSNVALIPSTNNLSLGTSTSLWNINANTIAGTLTTASQPNITANNTLYLGGNTAATLRSYSDSGAGTAYSNAVGAIATSTANAANYVTGGGSVATNTFTIGTAAYYVSNGNFGISTSTPGYKLDVNGAIRASGDIFSTSDVRVKTNIEVIQNALQKLINIQGVTFNKNGAAERSAGVIAQDVERVLPEVVSLDKDGYLSVSYGNMIALVIEAIRELNDKIDAIQSIVKDK